MRILHEEIDLREETRAAEQAKPVLQEDAYLQQATRLAKVQEDLAVRVDDVTRKIRDLPDGESAFGKELAILDRVEQVMREASVLLARPDTGPEPIAAETEAIELLLMSTRINPKGGGGGGASPGGGSTGDTDQAALALLGSGVERQAQYEPRIIQQATGNNGVELPAEFRHGLDAFFEALEQGGRSDTNQ